MAAPRIVTRPIISAYEAAVSKSIDYPNISRHFVFRVAFAISLTPRYLGRDVTCSDISLKGGGAYPLPS
jgi:hypothetical protein